MAKQQSLLQKSSACVTALSEAAIGQRRNRSAGTIDRFHGSTSDMYFYHSNELMKLYEASLATSPWAQADRYKVLDRLTLSLEPGLVAGLVVGEIIPAILFKYSTWSG